ncbi:MAG: bifunctional acetaldehyde-CoA/alcohol dehydrogenase [Acidobacteriota bacterium]
MATEPIDANLIEEETRRRREHLDSLVENARVAAAILSQFSQEQVDRIAREMVLAGLEEAQNLAGLAVLETGIGLIEDKVIKNMVATEFVWNYIKDVKTVGVIREYPDRNLKEVAEPIGVILAVTPITNPTSTVLFKSILSLKTRNAVIVNPHFRACACSNEAARVMAEATERNGAPKGTIQWIDSPSIQDTQYMMRHKHVSLIWGTGGPSLVRAAYSSGKPALGVGSGNTPVYIEKSANIDMAVVDIIVSKTFDNGTICASEQTVMVDEEIYPAVLDKFKNLGAYICSPEEVEQLEGTLVDREKLMCQPLAVGKKATEIASFIGLRVPPETKLLIAPLCGVGREHPLSVEKLCPVLGVIPVKSPREAINLSLDVSHFGGLGHTASIFSENEPVIEEFAKAINAGRIIVNSPASIGALGGVYNDLVPTFSFGCGTGGGNITIENVNVHHLMNIKRVASRTPAHQWFRVPNQIYFNKNSIENLRTIEGKTAIIVTQSVLERLGLVDRVRKHLKTNMHVHSFTGVEVEPTYETIALGVRVLQRYQPDVIIAIGGGSVIDAAKAMRLFHEHPDLKFESLSVPFLDPRKRVAEYPTGGNKARLIAIPTSSGTGSEVTPFAVISDTSKDNLKVTLGDYSLSPDIAIIDPEMTMSMPPGMTADTGLDCLTHAIESYVSIFWSEYTDALALQALRLVFEYLPTAYKNGKDEEARAKMANAACMAGIAISSAFVGINHSLAHALGARFKISHGRANAVFLPYTIRYNAAIPTKFMPFPNVKSYIADKKYAAISDFLGLGGKTVPQKVDKLIDKILWLMKEVDVPSTIAGLGVSEEKLEDNLSEMVKIAADDPSGRSNPRFPLAKELMNLFRDAYHGKGI